jgi:anti-sigma regulatory factor (Ser/Thr protein kinase)
MSTAPPSTRPGALTLPSDPRSPSRARAFAGGHVRHCLPDASDEYVDTVRLVVSELVTNACRYGTEPGDSLRLVLDVAPERTVVEVHDPVRRRPRPRPESAERDRGRGLAILDALCPRLWGVRDREFGKAVWAAVLNVPPDRLPGERLGVHGFLCEACRERRYCSDGRFLARAVAAAER